MLAFILMTCVRVVPVYDIKKVTGVTRQSKHVPWLVSFTLLRSWRDCAKFWWCQIWIERWLVVVWKLVDVDNTTYLLSEVMAKKHSTSPNIWGLWVMFGNATRVSVLGTFVLCEMNSGRHWSWAKMKYGSLSKEYTLNRHHRYQPVRHKQYVYTKVLEEIRRFLKINIAINTSQYTLTKIKITH
jgi:hypothetical protein